MTVNRKKSSRFLYTHCITGITKLFFLPFVAALDGVYRFFNQLPRNGNAISAPCQKEVPEGEEFTNHSSFTPSQSTSMMSPKNEVDENPALNNPLMHMMSSFAQINPFVMSQIVVQMLRESPDFRNRMTAALKEHSADFGLRAYPQIMMMINYISLFPAAAPTNSMMMMSQPVGMQQNPPATIATTPAPVTSPVTTAQGAPATMNMTQQNLPSTMNMTQMNPPSTMNMTQRNPPSSMCSASQCPENETSCCQGFETLNRTSLLNVTQRNENA